MSEPIASFFKYLPGFGIPKNTTPTSEEIVAQRRKAAREQWKKENNIVTDNDAQDAADATKIAKAEKYAAFRDKEAAIRSESRPILNQTLSPAAELLAYATPGVETLLMADDAAKSFRIAGEAIKHGQVLPAIGSAVRGVSEFGLGVASVAPVVGLGVGLWNKAIQTGKQAKPLILSNQLNKNIKNAKLPQPDYSVGTTIDYTPLPFKENSGKTSLAFFERGPAKISEAERLGIPKGMRNNKNIVREVPDSQLDDKIWILKDNIYQEGTFRDIKQGQQFKYNPQDAISYTYTSGPDKNPLNPDRYQLSNREFLGFNYMSENVGSSFLTKDSHIYNHIKMQSNSLLHDKLKNIAADIQIPREQYAEFLNPRYIQSFKQYYLNKGWRVGNLTDEEIAKIIAQNHKQLTSNQTGVAKGVILWNGSGKQTAANGTVVREAAPDNFKIITENLQGGANDIRGVWFSDFNDALSYGYPKQIGGPRQRTWEGVQQVDIQPYLINDARGHVGAGNKYNARVAPKNLILHSRELVSGDLDNIKSLFPHPELILQEGNSFTRSWGTKGLHYKKGGPIKIKKKNIGAFTRYCNGKVTEECIRKGKNSSNPTTRKRANFAWVARHKFKHEDGGKVNYLDYFQK